MKILPIQSYYVNSQPIKRCNKSVNFGNGFNQLLSQKALNLLKQNVIGIILCTHLNDVNKLMPQMVKRQENLYPQRIIEMFKLENEQLTGFLKDKVKESYYLHYFEGIGMAIGDGGKSIESWNKAFETLVCLVPKPDAGEYKYRVMAEMLSAK